MSEMNDTYWRNVNGNLIKVFFPFNSVVSEVGGIFRGLRVISTTDFAEHYDAILIQEGHEFIFLTSRWWEVVEGEDVAIYHVEGIAVMQSPKPFILRPVNWPEKQGWKFLVGTREGVDTGWRKV
jgi:hypothetical protein